MSKGDPAKPPEDEYSTVSECVRILTSDGPSAELAVADRGLNMVECELYAPSAEALQGRTVAAMPDISPYACFYGTGAASVLKVGWLDKLSPQG